MLRKNELPIHTSIQMSLIMLSGTQTLKKVNLMCYEQKADHCLTWNWLWGWRGAKRLTGSDHKETFWHQGNVLNLHCGHGCMGVYILSNLSEHVFKRSTFYSRQSELQ